MTQEEAIAIMSYVYDNAKSHEGNRIPDGGIIQSISVNINKIKSIKLICWLERVDSTTPNKKQYEIYFGTDLDTAHKILLAYTREKIVTVPTDVFNIGKPSDGWK